MSTVMMAQKQERTYERLGRAIAAARERQRISQPELARMAGVSKGYIGAIETGTRRPTPEVLRALATQLQIEYVALAELAGYVDAPPAGPTVTIAVERESAPLVRRALRIPRLAFAQMLAAYEAGMAGHFLEDKPIERDTNNNAAAEHDAQPRGQTPDTPASGTI